MNPSEYLPSENEPTAITIHEAQELQPAKEFIRIQCSTCSYEQGFRGKREHALDLIERIGWKTYPRLICPECVKKAARKFFERYRE